jgi:hypothetical protein
MNEYDLTLTFTIPNSEERDLYVEKIDEANCDEALIGIGKTGSTDKNTSTDRAIKDWSIVRCV